MRALLDVNVLIALVDGSHAFHDRAHQWWAANARHGWASCPLVENGFTRIMANPRYSASRRFTVPELVGALTRFVSGSDHEFWPDSVTLRDSREFITDRILGSRQLTDLYLLALAVKHGGRLATFDRGIPLVALKTAEERHLLVL